MRIAILDDDATFAAFVADRLSAEGHACQLFGVARALLAKLHLETYDLLVVDWNLPDTSGIEVVEWTRSNLRTPPPILLVTSRSAEADIVAGLNAGADDYVVKPVPPAVLTARVSALLRRAYPPSLNEAEVFGRYRFEPATETVWVGDDAVPLPAKEFNLALLLFRNLHRSLSRAYILEGVWGRNPDLPTRTLDAHVSRVRAKLGLRPANGFKLSPVYSYGYRLEPISADAAEA